MLKGKTIIELTDTKTGEVERYEDSNLVTQAINEIILKRKRYMGFQNAKGSKQGETYSSFISMFPLYKRFFGGIMLFSNEIDESRLYLNGDDKIVGSATFGNAYSGSDPLVGSYNSTESEINEEEKYAKFVYDFATNQGNGTISTVCLGNYHYIKQALYGNDCEEDYIACNLTNVAFAPYNNCGWGNNFQNEYEPQLVTYPTGITFSDGVPKDFGINTYCYENPIVFDEETGHLITLEYVSSAGSISTSNKADTIRLHIYDLGSNNVSLFGTFDNGYYSRIIPNEVFTKDFTVTTFGQYGIYNLDTRYCRQGWYDKSTKTAYLLGDTTDTTLKYWTNNNVMTMFKLNLDVAKYEDITLETINITNKTGKQIFVSSTHKQQALYRNICISNGYLYVQLGTNTASDGFAKININDSTDVTVFETGIYKIPIFAVGDLLYFGDTGNKGNTTFVKVLNTKTNEVKYTRVKYGRTGVNSKPIPFKNNDIYTLVTGGTCSTSDYGNNPSTYDNSAYWYSTICSRNDYFATINNLDTPVTKTNDKTMKITYILREG